MTWVEAAKVLGRRPITFVELYLDYCQLTYGVGACPAVLGVDSDDYCYNTKKTCPVSGSYDPDAKVYRFANRETGAVLRSIPCLKDTTFVSTKINPGKDFGIRGSVSVRCQDFPWADFDTDKYASSRSYTPILQGSYFGKLIARNPYYQNRVMKIYEGYLEVDGSVDLANFQVSTWLIDKIKGPDARGAVVIEGVEPLRLADDKKAQMPAKSNGTLSTDITDVSVSVTLNPAGIGSEYPSSGRAAMDEEIVNFTRVGDVITFNLRGAMTTLATSHTTDTTFQICKVYDDTPLPDVLYELLVTGAEVPASYIDLAQWEEECSNWLSGHLLNRTIAIPTGVRELINELIQTCLFYIWYSPYDAKIPFRAIRPENPADSVITLNDFKSFVADSLAITEDPDKRISQVWVHYNQKNPLLKTDELRNYTNVPIFLDAEAEGVFEYDDRRTLRILCPWFSNENVSQANVLGSRMLARYRDNPRTFKFELDAKDAYLEVGQVATVESSSLQDVTGAASTTMMQIISRTPKKEGHLYLYEATDTFFSGRYAFIMADGTPDYLASTQAQRNKGMYICLDSGFFANGDPGYKIP